jgi:hypothetical protein
MHKYIFRLLICILIVHGAEVKQKRDAAMKELCCFLCAEGSARQRVKVGGLGVVSATSQSILACQYLSSFAALGPESQPSVHLLTRALVRSLQDPFERFSSACATLVMWITPVQCCGADESAAYMYIAVGVLCALRWCCVRVVRISVARG